MELTRYSKFFMQLFSLSMRMVSSDFIPVSSQSSGQIRSDDEIAWKLRLSPFVLLSSCAFSFKIDYVFKIYSVLHDLIDLLERDFDFLDLKLKSVFLENELESYQS